MREIKFRAWSDGFKRMFIVLQLGLSTDENMDFSWCIDKERNKHSIYNSSLILMQYTGLKDKNGEEIYEGDIVIANDNGENFPVEYNEEKDEFTPCGKYKVIWECDYPAFDLREPDGKRLGLEFNPFTLDVEFEVIGNIYENPELLEKA